PERQGQTLDPARLRTLGRRLCDLQDEGGVNARARHREKRIALERSELRVVEDPNDFVVPVAQSRDAIRHVSETDHRLEGSWCVFFDALVDGSVSHLPTLLGHLRPAAKPSKSTIRTES